MSTPKTTPWKRFIVAFVILIVALGAIATAEGIALVNVSNDKTNLASQLDLVKSQLAKDNQTISALQNQLNTLQNQFNSYKANVVNVTDLSGTVTTSSGTPVSIVFYSGSTKIASASSAIYTDSSYSVVLANGGTYSVKIVYAVTNGFLGLGDGIFTCTATPAIFTTPSGPSTGATQNFFC